MKRLFAYLQNWWPIRRRRARRSTTWSGVMQLYQGPVVRPDGRWLRPLLPPGASPPAVVSLLLLSGLMMWALSSSLPAFMRYALPAAQVLIILGSSTGLFIVWYWLAPTWRRLWFVFPILLIGGVMLALRYAPWIFSVIGSFLFEIATTVVQARTGELETIPLNIGILIIGVSHLLLLWALVMMAWRRCWTPVFLLVGSLVFVWEWLFYFDPAFQHAVLFLTAGGLFAVIRHQVLIGAQWSSAAREAATDSRRTRPLVRPVLVSATVIVLTLSLTAQLLPASFKPVNTGIIGAWFEHAFPVLSELRGGGGEGRSTRFALSHTGFSTDDRELGGPVVLDEQRVMTVTLDGRSLPQSLYLRGAVREFYTGRGWQLTPQPTESVPLRATLPESQDAAVETTSIRQTIRYVGLQTSSIFAALGPYVIREFVPTQWDAVFADPGLDLWAPEVLKVGQEYTIDSTVPVYSLDQLRELSVDDNSLLGGDATEVDDVAGAFDDVDYVTRYLQLPPQLPRRVADLAHSLTDGMSDPVDRALALNDYLRKNYRYTLNPPQVPDGADFVDHFLFDEKQGYCTYHSTALVVMLRSIGIPARWVVGYVVQDPERNRLQPGVEYTVTNSNAHAWVEALIPGYGWLSLDPTPRFGGFEILKELPTSPNQDGTPQETDTTGGPAIPNSGRTEELDSGFDQGGPAPVTRRPLWLYAITGLVVVLTTVVVAAGTRLIRSFRADRLALTGPSGVARLYGHACALLNELGAELPAELTAREVLSRIRDDEDYPQELTMALDGLVPLLENRLYGGVDPEESDLRNLDSSWSAAVHALRRAFGLRRLLRARLTVGG